MNQKNIIKELSKLRPAATFLSLKHYRNSYNEVADYNIVFHINYENALRRSIVALECIVPEDDLAALAKQELIDGYNKSLSKMNGSIVDDRSDAYTQILDNEGGVIKGIKIHTATNILHIYGFINSKRVIVPGVYPNRNKQSLTIAKDKLRKICVVEKFRQFKIAKGQVERISVENLSMLAPV